MYIIWFVLPRLSKMKIDLFELADVKIIPVHREEGQSPDARPNFLQEKQDRSLKTTASPCCDLLIPPFRVGVDR